MTKHSLATAKGMWRATMGKKATRWFDNSQDAMRAAAKKFQSNAWVLEWRAK